MKTRNLFLLGLAATMLAGCGGARKYSKEVTKELFEESLSKVKTENPLFKSEIPYSFTFKMSTEDKKSTILLKDGNEVTKGGEEVSSESEVNFDLTKPAASKTSKSTEKDFGPGTDVDSKMETSTIWQAGDKKVYEVDKLGKTYDEDDVEDAKLEIFEIAQTDFDKIVNEFTEAITISDKAKYYIDDDKVYTIVNEYTDIQTDHSDSYKEIYQIVVENGSLEYYRKTETEKKTLNLTTIKYVEKSAKLVAKNVSVETVDLKDYFNF